MVRARFHCRPQNEVAYGECRHTDHHEEAEADQKHAKELLGRVPALWHQLQAEKPREKQAHAGSHDSTNDSEYKSNVRDRKCNAQRNEQLHHSYRVELRVLPPCWGKVCHCTRPRNPPNIWANLRAETSVRQKHAPRSDLAGTSAASTHRTTVA
eukprot:TRINITY_DN923_c0_g1_i1.p2 TRINITY_DN923_c0_g1~~TRINITY_DN923_c0_g1_i1.p2  ORF type:complete len:154 (+),score=5.66 TRINITY_DN923_c0_g1_i1:112-573(+)